MSKRKLNTTTPKHLHDGFVPVTRDDVTDLALLPHQFRLHAADVKQSFEILAGKILPLLNELRDLAKEHTVALTQHDRLLNQHSAKHVDHDRHHTKTDGEITGVIKRLAVVEEQLVIKAAPRRMKAKKK